MSRSFPSGSLDAWDDERLVAGCLGGSDAAWSAVVRRYERLVYAITRRYRLPESDAADAFQETFVALLRGMPQMREPKALCRWIASTAERISYASALRVRREQARIDADPAVLESLPGGEPIGTSDLETLEAQTLIRQAVGAMPERCRRLLESLYFEDPPPSYNELAKRFGVPIGSLGPTRARCFDRMRLWLRRGAESAGGGITEQAHPTYPSGGTRRRRGPARDAGPRTREKQP